MARRILGLDIGSHAVKAVELRQTLRSLEVVQLRTLRLDDPSPALPSELREFAQLHDLPTENVVVGLSGERVSTRLLTFPFKDRKKIGPAVPFEVESQVPFDLDDFFIDWEIVGESAGRSEVAASLAPRSEVALLVDTLHEAGMVPRIVECGGMVLGNLPAVFELPGTRLLADVGHRKTSLCLVVDGRAVSARTIPVGGLAITQALAKERSVPDEEGERLKVEEGIFGGPGRRESPAAIGVVDRLTREFLRTAGSLERLPGGGGDASLQRIDLMGGSAHLHRLDEYLQERTGVPTSRLPLPGGEMGAALVAGGDPITFAPAIALALRGSSLARTHMNFRQEDLAAPRVDLARVGREMRWTAVLAGVALLLACGSLVTHVAIQSRRADDIQARSQALYQQAFPGRPVPANLLGAMQEAVRTSQKRADTLGVYRGNLSALDILTEISRRVPQGLDVVFEELSIDRQVVQIKGHSPSFGGVDRLRAELAKYGPFSEITVGDITSDTKRGGQNFSVRISLSIEGGES